MKLNNLKLPIYLEIPKKTLDYQFLCKFCDCNDILWGSGEKFQDYQIPKFAKALIIGSNKRMGFTVSLPENCPVISIQELTEDVNDKNQDQKQGSYLEDDCDDEICYQITKKLQEYLSNDHISLFLETIIENNLELEGDPDTVAYLKNDDKHIKIDLDDVLGFYDSCHFQLIQYMLKWYKLNIMGKIVKGKTKKKSSGEIPPMNSVFKTF